MYVDVADKLGGPGKINTLPTCILSMRRHIYTYNCRAHAGPLARRIYARSAGSLGCFIPPFFFRLCFLAPGLRCLLCLPEPRNRQRHSRMPVILVGRKQMRLFSFSKQMNHKRRKNKQQITVLPSDRFHFFSLPSSADSRLSLLRCLSVPSVPCHERSPGVLVSLIWVPCHFRGKKKKFRFHWGKRVVLRSPRRLQRAEGSSVGKACAEGHTGREETT